PEVSAGDPFVQFHPVAGWTPRPNLDTHAYDLNGDVFHFTTDSDGWRSRGSLDDAEMVVFGDSFAFGYGIDDNGFFGDMDPSFKIKAIGAPGYNMVQAVHWMRELAPRTAGKPIVWLLYPPNDLEDNIRPSMLQYRTPFVREKDGAWGTVTSHLSEEVWPFPNRKPHFENFVDICSGTDLSRRVFSACRHLIAEAADIARENRSGLVIATVPELSPLAKGQLVKAQARSTATEYDPDLPDRRIAEICQEMGVSFVPLNRELDGSDYLENDVHWNASGHRKVHGVLKQIRGQAPPPPAPQTADPPRTPATVAGG
ncbi:MAG: hypothetical protein ACR2QM_19585, partial [Longimicrobiales bacterium]